jgi:hypothetical protein
MDLEKASHGAINHILEYGTPEDKAAARQEVSRRLDEMTPTPKPFPMQRIRPLARAVKVINQMMARGQI